MFGWISRVLARLRPSSKQPRLVMVASTQEPKPMPTPTDTCTVENKMGQEVEYKCGHRHAERYVLSLFGEIIEFKDVSFAKRELCADCNLARLRLGLIRCVICGFAIWPGDPVAVYADSRKFKKEWKTTVSKDKKDRVIGCMRWECCPSGGFFSGHWMGNHFAPAFTTGSAAAEAFLTGKPVLVNSIGKKEK